MELCFGKNIFFHSLLLRGKRLKAVQINYSPSELQVLVDIRRNQEKLYHFINYFDF